MAELKTLQDFYNPSMAIAGLNYQANQQHLALQQQQVAQQNQNLQIDNLQKALQTSDPMQSYPIYKARNELLGLPVAPVNEYYAKLPYHQQLQGAAELTEKVGLGKSPNIARLVADNPTVAREVAQSAVMSPLEQEKFRAAQDKNAEHAAVIAEMQPEMKALNTFTEGIKLGVETHGPLVQKLQGISAVYEQTKRNRGVPAAEGKRAELIASKPDLAKFDAEMKAAAPKTEEMIQATKKERSEVVTRLLDIERGVGTLQEGESVERLKGQSAALAHREQFFQTALAFQKNPTPATLKAMEELGTSMSMRLKELDERGKLSSQGRLDLETRKFESKQQEEAAQNYGQDKYLAYLNQGKNKNVAARLAMTDTAKQYPKVSVDQSKFKDLEEAAQAHEDKRQTSYTSAVKLAASLSGNSGMRFTTDSAGQAQFEMGTVTDPIALGKALKGLAEDQSDLLHGSVKKALLATATRLSGEKAAAPAAGAGKPAANAESSLRKKLGLE